MMFISVLIPTYRRPDDFCRCLAALEAQTRPADEVLVVVRDSDEETGAFLATFEHSLRRLHIVTVQVAGVVAAMSAGLAEAEGDIIALTDDDAVPSPDWLAKIDSHFSSGARVGGVGGRDRVHQKGAILEGKQTVVGKVQWCGRVIGNHHLGVGPARPVDVLKGVNCAYRTAALRPIGFDARMQGTGAQVHWELSLGLALKRAGWELVYDPAVLVEHYPSQRFDNDQRGRFDWNAHRNAACNEALAMIDYLPWMRRIAYIGFFLLLGTYEYPGLLQLPRLLLRRKPHWWRIWAATLVGRAAGLDLAFFAPQRLRTGERALENSIEGC